MNVGQFGAGRGELDDLPNCTQVVVGRAVAAEGVAPATEPGQPVVVVEAEKEVA